MGRPLNSQLFGVNTNPGLTLQFTSAWIPGETAAAANCFIVKQVGTSSFIAKNPTTGNSGKVSLSQTASTAGLAVMAVAPVGAGAGGSISAAMAVATFSVNAGGSGYAVGDILTTVGGTGATKATFTVSAVTSGAVTAVTLTTPGSYTVLPTAAVTTTTNNAGTGATINFLTYAVSYLPILYAGENYTTVTLTITGGGSGSGATGTANIVNGAISTTNLTAAGSGYTSIPVVTIINPVATYTAKKITSVRVYTFEGQNFKWSKNGTAIDSTFATLPLA